ncbi:MAG: DUF975 family protein [Blautia sp.]|nr:DUF975 family protein [Lachnoclostridium sp.]MCM1212029.1 DUF975 family protein [Blautia sp.]
MWKRKELKDRAKEALKRNYWKAVLVALLMTILGVGLSPATAASGGGTQEEEEIAEVKYPVTEDTTIHVFTDETFIGDTTDTVGDAVEDALADLEEVDEAVWVAMGVVFLTIFCIFMALVFLIDIFLINPLYVGAQRFMLKSVEDKADVAELCFGFDHAYKNNVKTAFHRDLQIFLWALLFLIPGIYKKYQYYMVDYILAENPGIPYKEVLERSKQMMEGQKWKTFVLDLSFILWHMLSTLTCGILEILYVKPYQYLTRASLYRTLSGKGHDNGL